MVRACALDQSSIIYCLLIASIPMMGACMADDCIVQTKLQSANCNCEGGHLLRVEWFGRLGNNLLQLAHVLHLAEMTHSEVIVPYRDFLNQTRWDFRQGVPQSCQIAKSDTFFYSTVCPAYLDKTVFSAASKRSVLQSQVLPAFQIPVGHSRDTIVVHIRGGDVFSPTPPPTYTQPPLAFYSKVLELPELSKMKIVLCTEDNLNPVVGMLQKQYKKRLTTITELKSAISTIMGAKHLVLGQSSFSEMLGMMAPDLQSVYVPFCCGREEIYLDLRQEAWGVSGYCFEYNNYISIDGWQNTHNQLQLMKTLSLEHVYSFALPV